jgi:hypothetical protein
MSTQQSSAAFVEINRDLASIMSRVANLAFQFKESAPRSDLDALGVSLMLQRAEEIGAAGQALLTIEYDPTPAEPDAP